MTRTAKANLDSFDPEVIEAARDVALRAGIPLEDWIAANVPQLGRRRGRSEGRGDSSAAASTRQAEERRPVAGRQPTGPRKASAAAAAETRAMEALLERLDGIDRALAEERISAREAEGRRLDALEEKIERRMSELGDRFAAARPYGRRGRAPASEIRDAVHEIRQRQRELGEGDPNVVAGMRRDLARRLDAGLHEELVADTAALVSELKRETLRLRESIGGLATSRDVGALEQAMISLATGVERAQPSADLSAIAAPIAEIRAQIDRLSDEVADNVHARVAGEVERLAARLGQVPLCAGDAPQADALVALSREIEEIRHLVGALAGPERIQSLAQGMQAISAQIAELQAAQAAPEDGLRPILEEIRSGLSGRPAAALAEQMRAMTERLDAFQVEGGPTDRAASKAILGRIDALADKVEQASHQPVGDLIGRLEGLGESLRGPGGDVASIHTMLNALAEKVERVGSRAAPEGLDALERQVVSLASRLDAHSVDPTLASLERTMGDLLRQVSALRESAPDEAALERAARKAVAASLAEPRGPEDRGEIGLLRAGLADLQAKQTASDLRLGTMLDGVQSALDRLMIRLDAAESGVAAGRAPSLGEQLLGSTAEAPRHGPLRRPDAPRPAPSEDAASARADELLEPGAGRPGREAGREPARERPVLDRLREPAPAEAGDNPADIKSSFIAAARRAAQAAQAELATEAAAEQRGELRPGIRAGRAPAVATPEGRLARLRAEIDRRRRPILLGLAAIVLALGALQALTMGSGDAPPQTPPAAAPSRAEPGRPPEATAPSVTPAKPETKGQADKGAAEASKPSIPDPQTTQAIPADPAPARQRAGTPPRVTGMAGFAGDLGGLPADLAKLKQHALDGDGLAVWELAMREAEGRGLNRDLALSAKLFEKLAAAGYAPAQYKLGGQYEKGAGLVRDLAQAKLWYGRAAEQGHARSMHNLAVIYAENPAAGGKPDYASAASWFRQGAEHGVRDSQYNLGVLYAKGLGVGQDLVQSYGWFAAAAAQGDDDAGKKRDEVGAKLSPTDLANAKSIATAFKVRKLDPAVNDAPVIAEAAGAVTLLGAPTPNPYAFTPVGRKGV
ncbi:SEL1-like repeat protein [Methylobacterium symbioticum]|nr:hypothetical protein [uncultured Methylobacterium sp.]